MVAIMTVFVDETKASSLIFTYFLTTQCWIVLPSQQLL